MLPTEGIVLQATDEQQAERAARGLRAVGILDLGGYVVDPAGATEQLEPIDLEELERLLGSDEVELVDVREKEERDDGYIVGSTHIPYRLVGPLADGLSADKPVVTICETGARASTAASVLAAEGIEVRPVIAGGVPDWEERRERGGGQTSSSAAAARRKRRRRQPVSPVGMQPSHFHQELARTRHAQQIREASRRAHAASDETVTVVEHRRPACG